LPSAPSTSYGPRRVPIASGMACDRFYAGELFAASAPTRHSSRTPAPRPLNQTCPAPQGPIPAARGNLDTDTACQDRRSHRGAMDDPDVPRRPIRARSGNAKYLTGAVPSGRYPTPMTGQATRSLARSVAAGMPSHTWTFLTLTDCADPSPLSGLALRRLSPQPRSLGPVAVHGCAPWGGREFRLPFRQPESLTQSSQA
jgi:hypothetical protein